MRGAPCWRKYGSNSLLPAIVLAMVDRKPLGAVWQLCYFWSLPCYLVGRPWQAS
jgi:hypothetical protein